MKETSENVATNGGPITEVADLRRVETLLRASAKWEPDASAPANFVWDALHEHTERHKAVPVSRWFARPLTVGASVAACAVVAAACAFFCINGSGGGRDGDTRMVNNMAPISEPAMRAMLKDVGTQINAPLLVGRAHPVAVSGKGPDTERIGDTAPRRAVNADTSAKTSSTAGKKQAQAQKNSRRKATPPALRRDESQPQEKRLASPLPRFRQPSSLLAGSGNTGQPFPKTETRRPPAAHWETETVTRYTYGTGTPVLMEMPSEDGSGTIIVPAVALNDATAIPSGDPGTDSE